MAGALVQMARGRVVRQSGGFPLCLLDLDESPLTRDPPQARVPCLVPLTEGQLPSLCYYCHRNTVTAQPPSEDAREEPEEKINAAIETSTRQGCREERQLT